MTRSEIVGKLHMEAAIKVTEGPSSTFQLEKKDWVTESLGPLIFTGRSTSTSGHREAAKNAKGRRGGCPMALETMDADEDGGDLGGGGSSRSHLWWALGGAAQIGWGISSFLRGYAGDSRLMPFKAFYVASLFVGGGASASFAALQASGIRKVGLLLARRPCIFLVSPEQCSLLRYSELSNA